MWLDEPSVCHVWQQKLTTTWGFLWMWGAKLDVLHCLMGGHNILLCSTKLSQKPVRDEVKTSFSPQKAFSATLCSDQKCIHFWQKLPLLQHPYLSLWHQQGFQSSLFCFVFLTSSMDFKGSLQQVPSGFVTTKEAISELEPQRSSCIGKVQNPTTTTTTTALLLSRVCSLTRAREIPLQCAENTRGGENILKPRKGLHV